MGECDSLYGLQTPKRKKVMDFTRREYPRPQFCREVWQPLNGEWEFCFDDKEVLAEKDLFSPAFALDKKILVPYTYQSKASGLGLNEMHEVMWYRRFFSLDERLCGDHVLLHFNAVDYEAEVWLNGVFVGRHEGGYTHFSFDVTKCIKEENILVVRVVDRYETVQPRGKQYWKQAPSRCWYTASSGIWQSVWLEKTGCGRLEEALITSDIDKNCIAIEGTFFGEYDGFSAYVSYKGACVGTYTFSVTEKDGRFLIQLAEEDSIDEVHFWSPNAPNLYDVTFEVTSKGKIVDRVKSYFAFRKISVLGDQILLNNIPLYQKLILDQGYWAESDLTPPSAESLKEDILAAKAMGFNGARKHQKIEDAYFYYYADVLGFLVWGEMPSAYCYRTREVVKHSSQYLEMIRQLYNHPSVIVWVPLNESWGVRKLLVDEKQKSYARSMYYLTKSVDNTRLVSTNDGWENVEETDIVSIHDYAPDGKGWKEKYEESNLPDLFPMHRRMMGIGEKFAGKPVMMTEYGGIAMRKQDVKQLHSEKDGDAWGYSVDDTADQVLARYKSLNEGLFACPFAGFCYTQLTDVKQEVNGLLDENHKAKFDFESVAKINDEWTYRK